MASTALAQHVHHVFEVFDVPALIGADGNRLRIFLQGGFYHFLNRAVVRQMNHLCARGLQHATHDVDRGVMAVKQTGCGDKPRILRGLQLNAGVAMCGDRGYIRANGNY